MVLLRSFITKWLSRVILKNASENERKLFRNCEKLQMKLVNVEQHRKFNNECIQHDLLPIYTNIRLHDATAGSQRFVRNFRMELIKRQVTRQENEIKQLKVSLLESKNHLKQSCSSNLKFDAYMEFLNRLTDKQESLLQVKHNKKLCNLYDGSVPTMKTGSKVHNISGETIDDETLDILNLGLNCHLKTKTSSPTRKIEIEKLYEEVKAKERNGLVNIENDEGLQCELKRIGLQPIIDYNSDLLTKQQYKKLRELKENENIIIRRADKSNTFVIMKKEAYTSKLDELLSDNTKFQALRKDPTEDIKKALNDYIAIINSKTNHSSIPECVGHFEPGYLYGNAKIHKNSEDPPLRPIISQIGTPVYDVSKYLNSIITKYMPQKRVVNSTNEFIELCKSAEVTPKFLASLDVESLFTNVPVTDTINIILDNVYNHPTIKAPDIPKKIMKEMMNICTTQCPFRNHDGKIYIQKDGVSMGSPLVPTFASFYMCHLENKAFSELQVKPQIYCRYVDDCFLGVNHMSELYALKTYFESNSVLNFTFETETCKKLSFLDVLISRSTNSMCTSVYTKPTHSGACLNYKSLCPLNYKKSVIKTFIHRAYAICSTWAVFYIDLQRIRQLLVNNHFPIKAVDEEIAKFLNSKFSDPVQRDNQIVFYYRNQFTSNSHNEEKKLRDVIQKHVLPNQPNTGINLRIFYQNKKLSSLLIKKQIFY